MLRKLLPALCLSAILISLAASAQTYTELISFNGNTAAGPVTPLTQGIDGDLYGTTEYGGTGGCTGSTIGCGIIFKITHSGQFQILYNFQKTGLINPYYGLVLAPSGDLYGVAAGGNAYGTIFKVTPHGTLSVVHGFTQGTDAGYYPTAAPTLGTDGNFYGGTYNGGAPSNSCPYGCGTIYKMTPSGVVTTLYSFCPQNYCPDGENPVGTLAQGLDGNFYGTTEQGGLYKRGTIFKITPNGRFTLLYTFQNFSPGPGLTLGNDGNFYGTSAPGFEFLYQVTPQGTVTQLPPFGGDYAYLPLVGSDGNLYWPSEQPSNGALFEMAPTGNPSTLYSFAGYPTDGSYPEASLVQATNGIFYGTTYTGGSSPCNYGNYPGCGTVYSLDMGLDPFVAFVNRAGKVGQQIGILGGGLKGATDVEFNGTPATFTARSQTLLIATVPAGAASGYVKVTTATRTLTSNVPFYVVP